MPGGGGFAVAGGGSPMGGRNGSMYKPPSKRPVDSHALGREPLVDLNANGAMSGDAKRQRVHE